MEADGRPTCALEAAPNLKAVVRAYSTEATSGLLVAPECGVRACAGRFGKTNGRRRPFVFNAVPCGPCPSTTLPNLSGSRSAASTMAAFQQCGPIVHVSASLVASPSDFNLLFLCLNSMSMKRHGGRTRPPNTPKRPSERSYPRYKARARAVSFLFLLNSDA